MNDFQKLNMIIENIKLLQSGEISIELPKQEPIEITGDRVRQSNKPNFSIHSIPLQKIFHDVSILLNELKNKVIDDISEYELVDNEGTNLLLSASNPTFSKSSWVKSTMRNPEDITKIRNDLRELK